MMRGEFRQEKKPAAMLYGQSWPARHSNRWFAEPALSLQKYQVAA